LWSAWEADHRPAPTAATSDTPRADGTVPTAPASVSATTTNSKTGPTPIQSGERIVVQTDLLRVEIDTVGGDIRTVDLLKHPVSLEQKTIPLRLMTDDPRKVYVAQTGLLSRTGQLPNHHSRFRANGTKFVLSSGLENLEVRLDWSAPDGTLVRKLYTFHRNSYVVELKYDIVNRTKKDRDVFLYTQFLHQYVEQQSGFTTLPTYTGGVIYTPDKKYEKINFDDMREKVLARDVDGGWIAILQHYFVGAWLPPTGQKLQFYTESQGRDRLTIGTKTLTPLSIGAGKTGELKTRLYAGPKEHHRLEQAAEGLVLTVDYGWLTVIAAPLFWTLEWLFKLVHNWGWAIILLTLLIKIVFYPLSVASYRSMAQMKKVQPRIQQLKERYKDDKQKFQQAMMELYKSEKINPLGGCLPILIQIPVFIALYWVLLESVELRLAPWALWIHDLSSPDPYFVLPVLMGATMLAQQWLNPQPLEDMQKKIMYILPVIFTVMFLFFPSGLVLYWVVQNFLSIAQQWSITRQIEGKK